MTVSQVFNPHSLTPEETEAHARLQDTHGKLIRDRDDLYARREAAQRDLDNARDKYKAACASLAAGKRANTEDASAEIRRCEAMIAGLTQHHDAKSEELQKCSASLDIFNRKIAAAATFAERARLEEALDLKNERIAQLKADLRTAEQERNRAAFELAEFVRQQP